MARAPGVVSQIERDRVDDAEPKEEDHAFAAHPVTVVVRGVQGCSGGYAGSPAETGTEARLHEAPEENRFEGAHGQRHDEQGNPVHWFRQRISKERDGELNGCQDQAHGYRRLPVTEPKSQVGQLPPAADGIEDRARDAQNQPRPKAKEQAQHVRNCEYRKG